MVPGSVGKSRYHHAAIGVVAFSWIFALQNRVRKQTAELLLERQNAEKANAGSTFRAQLPLTVADVAATPAEPKAQPPSLAGLRVLLAEDSRVHQLVTLARLEKFGCETRLAQNGKQALALVETHKFDLILMDCHMPELDGYAATAAIRALPDKSDLPIVALTANALDGERERCITVGMNDLLSKRFKPEDLGTLLERWVPLTSRNATSSSKLHTGSKSDL